MNCTELYTMIQDTCQNTETSFNAHLNDFIKATEELVFLALDGPLFYKTDSSVPTVSGQSEYNLVAGTIDVLGVRICETASGSVTDGTSGPYRYLLRKDIDFLYEAFPGTSSGQETGIPKYYSVTSASVTSSDPRISVRMGPVPGGIYNAEIEYYGKADSDSITTGSTPDVPLTTTTWLSVTYPHILYSGAVVQGYTYMKGDASVMASYEKQFNQGLMMLKNLSESRQDTDTYSDQGTGAQNG